MEKELNETIDKGRANPKLADRIPDAEEYRDELLDNQKEVFRAAKSGSELIAAGRHAEIAFNLLLESYKKKLDGAKTKDAVD